MSGSIETEIQFDLPFARGRCSGAGEDFLSSSFCFRFPACYFGIMFGDFRLSFGKAWIASIQRFNVICRLPVFCIVAPDFRS